MSNTATAAPTAPNPPTPKPPALSDCIGGANPPPNSPEARSKSLRPLFDHFAYAGLTPITPEKPSLLHHTPNPNPNPNPHPSPPTSSARSPPKPHPPTYQAPPPTPLSNSPSNLKSQISNPPPATSPQKISS